jgi:hypothetical protein
MGEILNERLDGKKKKIFDKNKKREKLILITV